MTRAFKLPDLGEGIHEAEIVEIPVAVGDEVEEDQTILVVETDKAAVEIPSPYSATVESVEVEVGDLVRVDNVMMTFSGNGVAAEEPEERPETAEEERPQKEPVETREQKGPVPASPATRRLARELDVDLRQVEPTGPAGRVTAQDVRAFAEGEAEREPAPAEPREEERERRPEATSAVDPRSVSLPPLPDFERWGEVERIELRSVRRSIAKQMALSWAQIPRVSHHEEADITELDRLRRKYKEESGLESLTLTVFIIKAAAAALRDFPRFNASLDAQAEEIVLKRYYHFGVAVDTERGLIVPVVRDVDCKSLIQLSNELQELAEQTRAGEAALEDLQGASFTITNVGILGGTAFTPIVNYPEVAILGMARAAWKPVVRADESGRQKIEPRLILPLVLAFDHRVADGADAARFMRAIVETLKDPHKLMLTL